MLAAGAVAGRQDSDCMRQPDMCNLSQVGHPVGLAAAGPHNGGAGMAVRQSSLLVTSSRCYCVL